MLGYCDASIARDATVTMTRAEFESKLNALQRKGRRVYWCGWTMAMSVDIAVLSYIFYWYPLGRNIPGTLPWYGAGSAITIVVMSTFIVVFKRTIARLAPSCSTCGAQVRWPDRAEILRTGRCPKCDAELVR